MVGELPNNNIIRLREQLPRPDLNTFVFIEHMLDSNAKPITVRVNGAEYRNRKPVNKPRTADLIVSFQVLCDVFGIPEFDLNSNGDVICKDDVNALINAKWCNFNYAFRVGMKERAVIVDNSMEFYDILNNILIESEEVPEDNTAAIQMLDYHLPPLIKDSVFTVKPVQVRRGGFNIKELKWVGGDSECQ